LRRPIDEKSDVWALGVLLYKLCYYTTPFEEHGPLAILNVQYRTPPYPVYSQQLNGLIGECVSLTHDDMLLTLLSCKLPCCGSMEFIGRQFSRS
jgi:AP2-associated kinase